ncbi:MAG: alpha/beta hydrolase [Chloroflexota bacterium]
MSQQILEVSGHQIAAILHNPEVDSLPVAFIHGITSSNQFWSVGQFDWMQDRKWVALGLPGHFPSKFPDDFVSTDLTGELVGQLLWEALDQLIGEQPVIIGGHSTGGFAAVVMASQRPNQVKGLFSLSGFVSGKWIGPLGLLQRFSRAGLLGRFLFRANFRLLATSEKLFLFGIRFYAENVKGLYDCPTLRPTIKLSYPDYQKLSRNAMLSWFSRMPDIDMHACLDQITAPSLVLHGREDPIVPFSQGKLIADKIPNAKSYFLDHCGHVPMCEQKAKYEEALGGWLQSVLFKN